MTARLAQPAAVPARVDRMGPQLDLDALADLVAERVVARLTAAPPAAAAALVDAATLAAELGVTRGYVYANADDLGAVRLGDGPRARLRFDLTAARARFTCSPSRRSSGPDAQAAPGDPTERPHRSGRRLPNRLPQPGSILASRPTERSARRAT